ncbi:hypothetical protein GQ42DRAFT_52131 [Ramicandelaber brevisporus]|nr:hypothetical protein GQ42DRAFT_52131 [Ramicandelaber brevisporus]
MIAGFLGALLFSFAMAALSELASYRYVYSKYDYVALRESLHRTEDKLLQEQTAPTVTNPQRHQRRIAELEKQIKNITNQATQKAMWTNMLLAATQIYGWYWVSNSSPWVGQSVGKLPFEPFVTFHGITHRGLEGEDFTEMSAVFVFMLGGMVFRPLIQAIGGYQIKTKGGGILDMYAKANETAKSMGFDIEN